jgi:hypothetical protein
MICVVPAINDLEMASLSDIKFAIISCRSECNKIAKGTKVQFEQNVNITYLISADVMPCM